MKRWMGAALAAVAGGMVAVPSWTGPQAVARAAGSPMQVVGFWANDAVSGLSGLYKYPKSITWFTPFWYSVKANGHLVDRTVPSIKKEVMAKHIPVTPLVNDMTGTQAFLKSPSTLTNAARNIADMVKANHYAGVSIDFEPQHVSVAPELSHFMVELRDFLPKGSVITLSVVPHSGGAYQWSALNPEVNQYVLMSYDQHDDGSYAGPVAATPWVQNIVTRMEKTVPPSKIDLGVALYGYEWPKGSTHAVTIPYNAVTPTMHKNAKWDSADQETYATFRSTSMGPVNVWWESLQGMNQKIQLAKQDHLAGIALWHMGYANDSVYQLLLHQVGTQP
ncbi:glycosyl hydrolase family 18 protein [Sulfobacillus harzensis]|uniref:Glycoside hydrolase n=1 Tax=Sulfobacillus harzensis TaxID=2729629 RepID=A0A7Y0L6E4_9FIRM|nr:glycosyl hydrolase family 18 protein [Sulfobacillus harzensis]NMP24070.1 glycoside hydrolase [Sulfobacillus harzensis]